MDIQVSHTHTREEAKRRIETLIHDLKAKYGTQITDLKEDWTGYAGKLEGSAKGYSVSGAIQIEPDTITVNLKIPFVLRVFSKKIKALVGEQLKNTLS